MKNIKIDLYDKLTNGILTPLLLILLAFFLALLMPVVEVLSGSPGLLIFSIIMIAGSAIMLERSIAAKYSEPAQARFGMAGGLVGWMVVESSIKIDLAKISSNTGVIIYMLVFLIVFIFWRKLFSVGAKFYFTVLLSCWTGHLFLEVLRFLSINNPFAILMMQIAAIASIGITLISLVWVLFRSNTPLERLWAAVVLGLSLATIAYTLRIFLPPFYL